MIKIEDLEKGQKEKICLIGLGYVGLPLALLFDTKYNVIGFDISKSRVEELINGQDSTLEVDESRLKESNIEFTCNPEKINESKLIIVTVPTPVDKHNMPDLTPIKNSISIFAKYLQKGSIIVYESTVYPGVTEEICVPLIEEYSGLKWKKDFFIGYSPERINPGDKEHTVEKIKKIVSGDILETTKLLSGVYDSVIKAGVYEAQNIKTAEAAKVIENIQRDINIALVNELSIIFNKIGIDTKEVINAASTKWNFIKFEPGLVGGHCIGVDPYYLTYKAEELGYNSQVILAGRRINDSMGRYVAENTIKQLIKASRMIKGCKILILGFTFKENTPDTRNTKIIDVYSELKNYDTEPYIYDIIADKKAVKEEYNLELIDNLEKFAPYDVIIFAVKHKQFIDTINYNKLKDISKNNEIILIDIKGVFDRKLANDNCLCYWRL